MRAQPASSFHSICSGLERGQRDRHLKTMRSSMPSSGEWLPFYEQTIEGQPVLSHGVSNAAEVIPSVTTETLSPTNPSSPANGQLTPKGSLSKSTRRRSRASKKTPTTLLNANANNFRALVQQFTGCPSTAISFGNQKGPVNLDFGRGAEENDRVIASLMTPFANNYSYRQLSQSQQQQVEYQHLHQQQRLLQEQQSMYGSGNTASDVFVSSSSTVPRTNLETANSLAVEDNISWHQLTMGSFSGDAKGDGFY